jgi:hypothetical protein
MIMKRFMSVFFVIALLGRPSMVMAAENVSPEAARLFRKGREEAKKGHTKEALDLFTQSEALEHSSRTQLNIADCEGKLGRVFTALQLYRALLASNPHTWKHVEFVKRNIVELTPRVPKLRLRLPLIETKGLVIKIDGKEYKSLDSKVPVELDPGLHSLVAVAPNHQEQRYVIAMREGQTIDSPQIQMQPLQKIRLSQFSKNVQTKTNWPGTMIGVGGVMVGFGAVMVGTGLLARWEGEETFHAAANPVSEERTNTQRAFQGVQTAEIGGREFYTGLALGSVGLALVVIGGRWLGTWERDSRKQRLEPAVQVSKSAIGFTVSRAF